MKIAFFVSVATVSLGCAQALVAGSERIESKDSSAMTQTAPAPAFNWTGFYLGVHGGYAWGDHSFLELGQNDPAYEFQQDGVFGGGQVGFNWQFYSIFVLGAEGTFAATDFSDDANIVTSDNERNAGHLGTDWMATVAARAGLSLFSNRLFAYAKGGVAFTQFDYHTRQVGANEVFDASDDQTVPVVGFGLEYAFTHHWSVKAEYNHLFFNNENVTGIEREGPGPGVARTFRADPAQDSVQAGINFKF